MPVPSHSVEFDLQRFDQALANEELRPEDIDGRIRVLAPLECSVATARIQPQVSAQTPVGKIVKLLWNKFHPEHFNAEEVLARVSDPHPMVRVIALEAITAVLGSAIDIKNVHRIRSAVERQKPRETSDYLAFQLEQLLTQTNQLSRNRNVESSPLIQNPYVAGPAIRSKGKFFGRKDLLRKISSMFDEGTRSIILYGARRTGKTSLLLRINEGALGSSFVSVYIDLQVVAGTNVETFLSTIVRTLETHPLMQQDTTPSSLSGFDRLSECLQKLLQQIQPRGLILLFDEFEVLQDFIKEKGLARKLQSLVETHARLFFIFAGSTKLEALKQKHFLFLLDDAKYEKISFLSPQDAEALITEPVQGALCFEKQALDLIQAHSSGHPFYTQTLCQSIFEMVQGRGTVTVAHVESAITKFMENPAPHLVLTWNALDLDKKLVLSALAALSDLPQADSAVDIKEYLKKKEYPIRLRSVELQELLSLLQEDDWIRKKDGTFRFVMRLIQRWIKEQQSIWDVLTEHRKRLVSNAAALSERGIAAGIDFGFLLVLVTILFVTFVSKRFSSEITGLRWLSFLPLLYFMVPMTLFCVTPGMLIMRMQIVNEAGGPLSIGRRLIFGLLQTLPIGLLFHGILFLAESKSLVGLLFISCSSLIILCHIGSAHFSKSRRGLFDELSGTVIIKPLSG
jgi:uncharacterized RDD family membrane protein YckC